jgi:hypothetical protein
VLDKIQYLLLWTLIATFVVSAIVRIAKRKKIGSVFELTLCCEVFQVLNLSTRGR